VRLVIALAFAGLAATGAFAQNASLTLQPGETLLEVESAGVHRDRPDVMAITAGVVTTGPTAAQALRENSELAGRLIETVRGRGIEPRDVRTTNLEVTPVFERRPNQDDDEEGRRIIGYMARNTVELRLRDLNRAPELLDAFLQAGANSVSGPRFSLSDDGPATMAAQREAVRLAREEAENYARALGMRIVRVLRVSERGRQIGDGYATIVITGSRVRLPPVEPGELETRVSLWVDFALAPQ
jgi:uncharacterized protein YggE